MASAPRASIAARTRREVIRRIVTKGRVRENLQNQGPVGQLVVLREPQVRIELTTARLRIGCSTPELLWPLCPGADSNRYAFRHHPLKMACLPISPPGQNCSLLLTACC